MKTKRNHKVLIAIPDPALGGVIEEAVSCDNLLSILATTEIEALEACEINPDIAVCIVDIELSQKYFPEILHKLHKILPRMGRLALCASRSGDIERDAREKEFCCYLSKPIQIEKLKAGISRCLEGYEAAVGGEMNLT